MSVKATVVSTEVGQKSKKGFQVNATLKTAALGAVVPLILVIAWEYLSRTGVFPPHLLPAPSVICQSLMNMSAEGNLWGHIGITLYRLFIGFLIGTAAAVVLGAAVGYLKKAESLFDPLIQAFRSIPSLAWVPLFILWMGIGEPSKVVLIAVGVFFPVYLNIVSGIQSVDRKLIEVGKIYNFSSLQLIRRIILPASLPSFLVGLRSGLGLGWMFVVAAELMGASTGIGYLLVYGQNTYSPDLIISSIVLFAILGKITDSILKTFEAKALHWQDTIEKKA
ncbi:ABC transporter permease [Cytobacillus purgationiresistens]|uniref:Sulfonate transport system permease protein n=1 Tax=Cytobacillus purgationiresistens TaxID=863449 RepID=A0ABU0ARH7_9BACI|nr:ABC transporter permease [Cytobacillus purgationiresistens]MDQ0273645.1 sulfonate transport system permease protein [Cytobacillus purgationiresistens]